MLAHFLYDSTSLAIAAYSLHAEAAVGATTQPTQSGLHLSTADITMLAVGAVLMAIGWLLWRTANPPRLASNAAGAFDVMPASQSPSPGK